VPVLLYGWRPSADELECRIFDAAHAHGWRPPEHAAACWSFYPTKTLGGFGDGGAVTTNDASLAGRLRRLCGREDRWHDRRQITSRMDEVQAAVLRVKLGYLDQWLAERRRIAGLYWRTLPQSVQPVVATDDGLHHLVAVRCEDRDSLQAFLAQSGIETKVHFPVPLHRLEADWARTTDSLPGAEAWCSSVLSLPCYPGLRDEEVRTIGGQIERWASGREGAVSLGAEHKTTSTSGS
jgi:dTDP-4-amino-4,6-dideoxygalactose transaminase